MDSLKILSANLNRSAKALTENEGTAGLLLKDKQLYEKINTATDNLNALIKDIQEKSPKIHQIQHILGKVMNKPLYCLIILFVLCSSGFAYSFGQNKINIAPQDFSYHSNNAF